MNPCRLSAGQTAVDVILTTSNQVYLHLGRETDKYLALQRLATDGDKASLVLVSFRPIFEGSSAREP